MVLVLVLVSVLVLVAGEVLVLLISNWQGSIGADLGCEESVMVYDGPNGRMNIYE